MDLRAVISEFIVLLNEELDEIANDKIDDFTSSLADKAIKGNEQDYDDMVRLLRDLGYEDEGDPVTDDEIMLNLGDYISNKLVAIN